jgi:hypothetical protein
MQIYKEGEKDPNILGRNINNVTGSKLTCLYKTYMIS